MCFTRSLCYKAFSFEQFLGPFFGQMCPFATFQTKNHVAVSIGCSGKGVVNNYVEWVRSCAVITIYPELVQSSHVQLAKTLGREVCPSACRISSERIEVKCWGCDSRFLENSQWMGWEELIQQSKKKHLQVVMGTPCTFSFKKLWVSRRAEKTQIAWMSRWESKGLWKKSTIWPFVAMQF